MIAIPSSASSAPQDPELLFEELLQFIDSIVQRRLRETASPVRKRRGPVTIYRFPKKDFDTYLFLRMVQFASNLRAGKKLVDHGFLYEWKILDRAIAESTNEARALFLAERNKIDGWEKLHEKVLIAFFQEDINKRGEFAQQRPIHVPGNDIRKAMQSAMEEVGGISERLSSRVADDKKNLHKFKSGYVHGRAASIMSLYDHETDRFSTNGEVSQDAAVELRNLWRATYSVMGCIQLISLKWFESEFYQKVWERTDFFRQIAGI